jgi:chlorobactene glucosyltransferase
VLIWLSRHFRINQGVREMLVLDSGSPRDLPDPAPLVSVLIPARDEEETIRACVEAIMAQTYPNFEVLVVNDRSEDRTAEIVSELAGQDPRVRLINIAELPAGWTGKTHGLWKAVKQAKGEYLLFIDSDTIQEPENLTICMSHMLREDTDMLSLLPRMRNETFWEHVTQPLASICLMLWFSLHRVNDPKRKESFGNGQYILMRRSAYDAIGGHEAVKSELVEDIHLARAIKGNGHRLRVAAAQEISSTRMYTSLATIIKGWARIYFAAADRAFIKLMRAIFMMVVFSFTAYAIFAYSLTAVCMGAADWFTWTLLSLSIAHLTFKFTVMHRLYRLGKNKVRYLPLYLLSAIVVHAAQWSALSKVFTRQVTWRGTAYPQSS